MVRGDNTWFRAGGGWTWHNPANFDPEPAEEVTPIEQSEWVVIANDPPCEECEMDCPSSNCPDIRFDSIAPRIPGLRPDDRRIGRDWGCGWVEFQLAPVVTAPHLVASRAVHCNCSKENMRCRLESFREVYESDPTKSIPISNSVTVDDALEILTLFRESRILDLPKDFLAPAGVAGIYRNGENFELYLANCGENALVRLERTWLGRRLRYLKGIHGHGCV